MTRRRRVVAWSLLLLAAACVAAAAARQQAPRRLAGRPPDFMPDQESWAGGDVDKHYFLMGPRPGDERPEAGYGLVVILPGGDGGDFHPWCRTMAEQMLPVGFVAAQLVAPVWNPAQPVVWPTRQLNPDRARFTTEDFVLEVIAEARARLPIDDDRIFVLGWSSGGTPAYAVALLADSPVRGAFVAMSIFRPDVLPDLSAARGRAFYILHSRGDDLIAIDAHAAAAAERLAAAGAATELSTYSGPHGWPPDAPARIGRGIQWLSEQTR